MFYLIELSRTTESQNTAKAIYEYSTREEAVANFHTKLGGAMKNASFVYEMVMVINDHGAVICFDSFNRAEESEEE